MNFIKLILLLLVISLSTSVMAEKKGTCEGGYINIWDPSCNKTSECLDACISGARDGEECGKGQNERCKGKCDRRGANPNTPCRSNPECVGLCEGKKGEGDERDRQGLPCNGPENCNGNLCLGMICHEKNASCSNPGKCYDSDGDQLLIKLASFNASRTPNGILLEWETEVEKESSGVNLYCAKIKDNKFNDIIKINVDVPVPTTALIPFTGNSYSYSSNRVLDPMVYYCILEEVNDYGECSVHCDFIDIIAISDEEENTDPSKAMKLCKQYSKILKSSCIKDVLEIN